MMYGTLSCEIGGVLTPLVIYTIVKKNRCNVWKLLKYMQNPEREGKFGKLWPKRVTAVKLQIIISNHILNLKMYYLLKNFHACWKRINVPKRAESTKWELI